MSRIKEVHIEDWICANLEQVIGEPARLIGRQVELPVGRRCDVLATVPRYRPPPYDDVPLPSFDWVVIEVKRRKARSRDLTQLLDYMGRLWSASCDFEAGNRPVPQVSGYLVAPGFDDRVAMAVCAVENVTLYEVGIPYFAEGLCENAYPFVNVAVDDDRILSLLG